MNSMSMTPDVGERTALVDDGGELSYGQLVSKAIAARDALIADRPQRRDRQVPGDVGEERIPFLVSPGRDYVATLLGVWAAGGVAVPLSTRHPLPEIRYVLEDTGARRLIVAAEFSQLGEQLSQQCGVEVRNCGDLISGDNSETDGVPLLPAVDESRRAMVLYTSGSTGKPKGVVTSHRTIAAQVDSLVKAWQWQADDRILHVLPLHHIHGIVNVLLCAMRVGAVCEFAHPFRPETTWQRLASGEITLFMAVPTIYAKLIEAFESVGPEAQDAWSRGAGQMRLHVSGSAALPVPVLEQWEAMTGQRLLERYGMTEIGMALSNPYDGDRRAGFVGQPLPGVVVRRCNEAGEDVVDDQPGEIEVRGANVFHEYWNRPEETAQSFRDGWFRTGDIAVVENGAYRILGRSSVDIIKTGGYKVSALEIEDSLRNHASVKECAVVGVPDQEWGERVAACVVVAANQELDIQSLRDWGKQEMASYKVPSLLCVVDELPRNAMGKVQKRLVQQMFESP